MAMRLDQVPEQPVRKPIRSDQVLGPVRLDQILDKAPGPFVRAGDMPAGMTMGAPVGMQITGQAGWPDQPKTGSGFIPDKPSERGPVGEAGAALGRTFLAAGKGVVGTAKAAIMGDLAMTNPTAWHFQRAVEQRAPMVRERLGEALEPLDVAAERIETAKEKIPRTWKGPGGWAYNTVTEAVGYMGMALAAGYTGGPVGSAMVAYTTEGQQAYDKAKAGGATDAQANQEREIVGSITGAIEALQIDKLMKFHKAGKYSLKAFKELIRKKAYKEAAKVGGKFGKDVLKNAVTEGVEEFSQQGVSLAVPAAMRGDYPKTADGKPDWWAIGEEMGAAALGGAVAGGVLGAGGIAVQAGVQAAGPSVKNVTAVAEQVWADDRLTDVEKGQAITQLRELVPEERLAEITESADTFNVPEATQKKLDALNRLEENLTEYEARRQELEVETKKKRGRKFARFKETLFRAKDENLPADRAMAQASAAMKGFSRQIFPEFEQTFSQHEMRTLQQSVVESVVNDRLPPAQAMKISNVFNAIINDVVPSRSELQAFDTFFGTRIVSKTKNMPQTKLQKVWHALRGVSQTYKTIKASCEHSYGLVQGFPFAITHPVRWAKVVAKSHRSMLSDDYVRLRQIRRKMNPHYHKVMAASRGKYFTEVGTQSEEEFAGNYADKIPIFKYLAKGSERAHVDGLNGMREIAFDIIEDWGDAATFEKIEDLTHHLSNMTSRGYGDPKKYFEKHIEIWSQFLWTPRMLRAELALPFDIVTKPHIRKIIAHHWVRGAAMLAAVTVLVKGMPGVDVDDDPRSSTFGRGKVGDQAFNMWPRQAKYVRTAAQIAMQEKVNPQTGEPFYKEWEDTAFQFLRGKLNPTLGVGVDVLTGRTYEGKPIYPELDSISEYALRQISPLFIKDVADAIRFQGMGNPMPLLALGGYLGADMLSFENNATAMAEKLKSRHAHEYFGKEWWELGPEARIEIRKNEPRIKQYEEDAKHERDNYKWWGDIKQREHDMGVKVVKKLPRSLQRMYERSGAAIVPLEQGLHYNGEYWKMNLRTYERYQRKATENLTTGLRALKAQVPDFGNYPAEVQRQALEDLAKDALKAARTEIIGKIRANDIECYERTRDERKATTE